MKSLTVLKPKRVGSAIAFLTGAALLGAHYSGAADAPAPAAIPGWQQHLKPMPNEGWEVVPVASDQFVLYFSPTSEVRQASTVTASVRGEWRDPQENPHSRIGKFLSTNSRVEFNCATRAFKHLADDAYAGNNLTGESSSSDPSEMESWTALFPEAVSQQLLNAVCPKT